MNESNIGEQAIKFCPFCGGTKNIVTESWFEGEKRNSYSVACMTPDCHGEIFIVGHGNYKTEREAVEAWNKRAFYSGLTSKATDNQGNEIPACPHGVLMGWCYHCGDVNKGIYSMNVWTMPR